MILITFTLNFLLFSEKVKERIEIISNFPDEMLKGLVGKKFRATGYNLKFTCEILSYSRYESGVFCTVNNSNEYGVNQINLIDLLYNYSIDIERPIES